ncbi:hypothetical protein [Chthoniobacter sp.]|uniref:hypothetical protein n=1 Tax=Chthoniobacter sp. TaxID=2510640 RepID=UPI0032AEC9AE
MDVRRHSKKLLAAAFVVVVVTFLVVPIFPVSNKRGTQVVNGDNAYQLAQGCKIYALDHEGRFPMDLSELEPDYLSDLKERRYLVDNRVTPLVLKDWKFFGAGFTEKDPPPILIAAPDFWVDRSSFFRFRSSTFRVYVQCNSTGSYGKEAEYQKLLAEMNRRRSAMHEPGMTQPEKP